MSQHASQATAAAAADERIGQLLALIERLTQAIERERASFDGRRPRELAVALAEKEPLAELYAKEMRALAKDWQWIEAASPAMRERLRGAVGGIRRLLAEYSRAILARRSVVEGLVRALGHEVARQRQPFTTYGGAGMAAAAPRGGVAAIAFDQSA